MLICDEAVTLLTLAYADQFNFPLKTEEISQRLIKRSLSNRELSNSLTNLKKKKNIKKDGVFWKLNQSEVESSVRKEREVFSQKKWLEIPLILKTIGWIPWIRGVAVTGSLAVNNVLEKSDIDLMIIVQPNRLWISRILVSLSTFWTGKRRTWDGSEDNSWCFNLWLDKKNMQLPHDKRNLYSAYEVCQSKWVLDRDNIEERFLVENSWVNKLLPQYFSDLEQSVFVSNKRKTVVWLPIISYLGRRILNILNLMVFGIQYSYMYSHKSRERVGLGFAYFHPRSTKFQIYQRWYNSLYRLWIK